MEDLCREQTMFNLSVKKITLSLFGGWIVAGRDQKLARGRVTISIPIYFSPILP